MFAEVILSYARAEEARENVFLVRGTKSSRSRYCGARGFQGGEPRKFVGGRGHLSTQAVENRERRFLCPQGKITCGPYAGWAALLAVTGRD